MKIVLCKGRFAGPISGADETIVAYAIVLRAAGHDACVTVLHPPRADDPHYRRLLRNAIMWATNRNSGG